MDDPFDPWSEPHKLETVESWFRAIWARPVISWAIIGVVAICCIWFWFIPPLPGVAVTVLGATAAIMTFREMHNTHKVLATLAISALMGIELRDIRLDRDRSDSVQADARKLSEANFKTIGVGITTSIQQSQSAFDATMRRMEKLGELSKEDINEVTGGDSFCYIEIAPSFNGPNQFALTGVGKFPISGLQVTIINLVAFEKLVAAGKLSLPLPTDTQMQFSFPLPNKYAGSLQFLPVAVTPEPGVISQKYQISLRARNGLFTQVLRRRLVDGIWRTATLVAASYYDRRMGVVLERLDKGFPMDTLGDDKDWQSFDNLKRIQVEK